MAGGILFGPWVGIATGVIAGLHRFLIDIHGVTSVPCLITSIIAGIVAGGINRRVLKEHRWRAGIVGGMLCEALTMLLIVVWARPTSLGLAIVSEIALPMILGASSIGIIVLLVQSVEGEKEAIAARQAKLALEIANKTLPLFRQVNSDSLRNICDIIRREIKADAVAMTDKNRFWPTSAMANTIINMGMMASAPPRRSRSPAVKLSLRTTMKRIAPKIFTP